MALTFAAPMPTGIAERRGLLSVFVNPC